jgi:hypothetical protein
MSTAAPTKKRSAKKPATVTTGTPRTHNEGAWTIEATEPHSDPSRSRFGPRKSTPEGHSVSPAEAIGTAYRELVQARIAAATPIRTEKDVDLFYVGKDTETGEIRRLPRGTLRAIVEVEVESSRGRFSSRPSEAAGALLDRLMIETPAPEVGQDSVIWDALEQMIATEPGLASNPVATRAVNDAVAQLCCLRAGLRVPDPTQLPAIGRPHR